MATKISAKKIGASEYLTQKFMINACMHDDAVRFEMHDSSIQNRVLKSDYYYLQPHLL